MTQAVTPIHLLDQTVSTQRYTTTLDASRSPVNSYTTRLSAIAARVQPMSGSEAVRYGRESTRRMFRVFVEPGQDITEKDRVLFVDQSQFAAKTRTLEVVEKRNPQSANVITTLICEETE